MVNTSSQLTESEKRRKQTLEKAKAIHLSRQLQMRLQYAKLKVDHGWQKQNLNEVENLYFHHSHIRGKPRPNPVSVTTTLTPSTSNPHPAPNPSTISFRQHLRAGSINPQSSPNSMAPNNPNEQPSSTPSSTPSVVPSFAIDPALSALEGTSEPPGEQVHHKDSPLSGQAGTEGLMPPTPPAAPSPAPASPPDPEKTPKSKPKPRPRPKPKLKPSNPPTSSSSSTTFHFPQPSAGPSLPDAHNTIGTTSSYHMKNSSSSRGRGGGNCRTNNEKMNGFKYSTTTPTYDSFWSSHSSSSASDVIASRNGGSSGATLGGE